LTPPGVTPLLAGALVDRARDTVAAIEERLAAGVPEDPSLANGAAGVALFWAYRARVAEAEGDRLVAERAAARAEAALDAALDAVAAEPLDASFAAGFSGVAWVAEHLAGGAEDPNEEVDAALGEALAVSPWRGDHDLVSGLVGIGVYGLERALGRGRPGCLALVIARLAELAEERAAGLAWPTPAERLPEAHGAPRGYDNLGMAHGAAGVTALLAAALGAGVEASTARRLLGGAAPWMLAQDGAKGFPSWVGPGLAPPLGPQAWCHGDPGVAAALWVAGEAASEPGWRRAALGTAHRAAARERARGPRAHLGLCHGTAGVAHILARLARGTGDEALAEAARGMWAGLLAKEAEATAAAAEGTGWLDGAAGLGLALLSATSAVEPAWDRALLLSRGALQPPLQLSPCVCLVLGV
jgi:hypothetical protein